MGVWKVIARPTVHYLGERPFAGKTRL